MINRFISRKLVFQASKKDFQMKFEIKDMIDLWFITTKVFERKMWTQVLSKNVKQDLQQMPTFIEYQISLI